MYFYSSMNKIHLAFFPSLLLILLVSLCQGQIITIDTSKNISRNVADDMFPEWSPNSKKLVYQSDRNGNWNLFVYDLESDSIIQLTNNINNEQNPQWHPDGNHIVYDSDKDSNQYFYKINLQSLQVSPLFDRKIEGKMAKLAPDGRMVYFLGFDDQHEDWELFSYHFIYDNLNQLTSSKKDGLFLDLSPDGKKVLYGSSSSTYPFSQLHIYNWYGSELGEINDGNIIEAIWHPDRLKIYFISDAENEEGEIYSVWSNGSHLTRMTEDDFKIHDISIAPDGKYLACSVSLNGNYEILIIPLESF